MAGTTWEYVRIEVRYHRQVLVHSESENLPDTLQGTQDEVLAALGAVGWEMVGVTMPDRNTTVYTLKRQVPSGTSRSRKTQVREKDEGTER